jgi:hypothetical protein
MVFYRKGNCGHAAALPMTTTRNDGGDYSPNHGVLRSY